jgi:peroxiredoxin
MLALVQKLKMTGAVLAVVWLVVLAVPHPLVLAPDLTLTTIMGRQIDLKALHGKPAIVTFWATDCPSCIKEIPHLRGIYQEYQARGLVLIAVAMYYDPPSHVVAMSEAQHLPYSVALDLKGEAALAFGKVALTPTTFLIAPDGHIAKHYLGMFDFEDMRTAIDAFLKG